MVMVVKVGWGDECLHHPWLSNSPSSLPSNTDVRLGATQHFDGNCSEAEMEALQSHDVVGWRQLHSHAEICTSTCRPNTCTQSSLWDCISCCEWGRLIQSYIQWTEELAWAYGGEFCVYGVYRLYSMTACAAAESTYRIFNIHIFLFNETEPRVKDAYDYSKL